MVPTIAIDAMGGDLAPDEIVAGAVETQRITRGRLRLVLVGKEEAVRQCLDGTDVADDIEVVNANDVITMHDDVSSMRQKKDSSLAVAIRLQKEGRADAVISAGNTGIAMATSLLELKRIPGVLRPAIAVPLPTTGGGVLTMIDGGANSACKPEQLYQFGVMGSTYHSKVRDVPNPRVGLLSLGEEDSKGDAVVQEAYKLLAAGPLNFIGNIEGNDVLPGKADVVVCDGFMGNVLLKFAESSLGFMKNMMREAAVSSLGGKIGALLLRGALRKTLRRYDYQEYGGAPLLGINGITIICHGRSTARAIRNAVLVAEKEIHGQLNKHIRTKLER